MKQILIINGSGGVGKDTFVECIKKHKLTIHRSIAEIPKEIAKKIGWDGGKTEKDRLLLCSLKSIIDEYNDNNFKLMTRIANSFLNDDDLEILCIDMREKKDIERFKNLYKNTKTIFITRKNVEPIKSNPADANVGDYTYDFYISNNGNIDDLEQKAIDLINKLGKEVK